MATLYFRCPCKKTMAVDEKGAGMTVACPDCGRSMTVPAPVFQLDCPSCNDAMTMPEGMTGQAIQCVNCGKNVTVPDANAAEQAAPPPAVAAATTATAMMKISSSGILVSAVESGAVLGGFQTVKLLGKGAMGEVWLAKQLSMDREVALKILPPQFARDRDYVSRFMREVRLAAKLEHAHIVTAYEAGEANGVLFLAMAYMRGETLEARLTRGGPMSEAEASRITHQIAEGLAYAWDEHRLLHRDVKPANIMLDAQGNAKLMDMGISKSLADRAELTLTEMMIGSPNYMSPEQIEGKSELDFRADIYSLGMTLYHMLTGKVPFGGSSVMETLRKQVMEALPSVLDINPGVSPGCVTLLEIMLAKNRERRYAGWRELLADLDRVLAGNPPATAMVNTGESIMLRAGDWKPRIKAGSRPAPRPKPSVWQQYRMPIVAGAAAAVVVIGLVTGLMLRRSSSSAPSSSPVVSASNSVSAVAPVAGVEVAAAAAQQAYGEALEYEREHGGDYAGAIRKYEEASRKGEGTDYKVKALEAIQRLEVEKKKAVEAALDALKTETEQRVAAGKYEEALRVLEQESGPLAAETAGPRAELAAGVKAKLAAVQEQKEAAEKDAVAKLAAAAEKDAQAKLTAALDGAAGDLLKGDYTGSVNRLKKAQGDPELAAQAGELETAKACVLEVTGMPELLAGSFEREKGQEAAVEFKDGHVEKVKVTGVVGQKVDARREIAQGFMERSFLIGELSVKEKMRRLGENPAAAYGIMRGLLLAESGDWSGAEKAFQGTGNKVGEALARAAGAKQGEQREVEARQILANLLRTAGVAAGSDTTGVVATIQARVFTSNQTAQLRGAVAEYRKRYGETETGKAQAAILAALAGEYQETGNPVAQKAGDSGREQTREEGKELVKEPEAKGAAEKGQGKEKVRELKPIPLKECTEENVQKALEALRKANPQIGKAEIKYEIRNDQLSLEFKNLEIKDLGPLAGLPITQLAVMNVSASDLAPLCGMPLKSLQMYAPEVHDLSPLVHSSLTYLYMDAPKVKSLEPLKYLKDLTELILQCSISVTDISVLRGLQLKALNLYKMPVSSLDPLQGMTSLQFFVCEGGRFKDLASLQGLALKSLDIRNSEKFESLVGIEGMASLEMLALSNVSLKDISPVKGLQLKICSLRRIRVSNLAPLAGMTSLTYLDVCESPVKDLAPLQGLPLTELNVSWTQVSELTALAGMPLETLKLMGIRVKAFKPLAGLPVKSLALGEGWTKVEDADKLPDYLPAVESLCIPPLSGKPPECLFRWPSLTQVCTEAHEKNGLPHAKWMPIEEFKKKYAPAEKAPEKTKGPAKPVLPAPPGPGNRK